MFDISWSELVLIGLVALIVIGPKELPGVLRMVGQWSAKLRRMAAEFQGQFQEAMREAEMADLKKQVDEISDSARNIGRFDPLTYEPEKAASASPSAAAAEGVRQPALPAASEKPAIEASPGKTADAPAPSPARHELGSGDRPA
jgi:sec-independent protein translocase protein TatB